jgi:hypothetical protein
MANAARRVVLPNFSKPMVARAACRIDPISPDRNESTVIVNEPTSRT